jgi:transcriptional regulator GlxA family with amidase domain
MALQMIPKVKWNGEKQRVIGKFWTAGGAFAATDMFAHWVMENYGRDVGEAGYNRT